MGRSPCCEKIGLKKGPWTPEEDQKLLAYIKEHGHGSWRALPSKAGLQRCGKSCRLRWTNYLRPDIKRGKFSLQEEQTIIQLHALLGNRWSAIATHLPKRTDNEIKNYWNTHLKKRLTKMGIDPVTHKPRRDAFAAADGHCKSAANLNHMAQWESARLEAEARLARESKLCGSTVPPPSASAFPTQLQPPMITLQATPSPSLDVLRAWQGMWSKPSPNGNNSQGESQTIDLESPTSTLSFFSENMAPPTLQGVGNAEGFVGTEASSWLTYPCRDEFAAGFTRMLTNEQNSSEEREDSDIAEDRSCVDMDECKCPEEDDKSYWSSILNMVNSSSPTNLPPPVL